MRRFWHVGRVLVHLAGVLVTGRWGRVARAVDEALTTKERRTMLHDDPQEDAPDPASIVPNADPLPETDEAPANANVPDEPSEGG